MNAEIHLEHRAGSSQGKHEGEPSLGLCDRLDRTRDNSQRQLPTDHDYAVSTREYQTDQSSLKTAPTAARSVFGKGKQRQRQPHYCAELTRSLHIRPMRSSTRQGRGFHINCRRKRPSVQVHTLALAGINRPVSPVENGLTEMVRRLNFTVVWRISCSCNGSTLTCEVIDPGVGRLAIRHGRPH